MMLREARRVQVRGDILRVCEKMFRAWGFDRTSIDDIAAAAGISRQTFFNYFPGKDAVVAELAVEWLQRQGELPKLDGGAGKKSVLAGARAYVAMQARAIEADRKFMALVIAHAGPFAAAGGIEAIFSVLAIRDNVAPPTINLENPDEGCDLDYCANAPRERRIDIAMSNSFGFGGTNGSVVFRRI